MVEHMRDAAMAQVDSALSVHKTDDLFTLLEEDKDPLFMWFSRRWKSEGFIYTRNLNYC